MFKELNLDDYTRTHIQVLNSFPRLPHLITSYIYTLRTYNGLQVAIMTPEGGS